MCESREQHGEKPQHRQWYSNLAIPPPSVLTSKFSLRLVSLNVLSQDNLQICSHLYQQTPLWILQWPKRWQSIIYEILFANGDIYALQEVHHLHYQDTFYPFFKRNEFEGRFLQRTDDKTDGVALFWKTNKYSIVSFKEVRYTCDGILNDNVGLAIKFRHSFGIEIVVGVTHLLFNPKRGDLKLAQLQSFLLLLYYYSNNGCDPVFLTGDFNAEPESPLYTYILNGELVLNATDRRTVGQTVGNRRNSPPVPVGNALPSDLNPIYALSNPTYLQLWDVVSALVASHAHINEDATIDSNNLACIHYEGDIVKLKHPLNLLSAYLTLLNKEPKWTHFHQLYKDTVDYIFFSPESCQTSSSTSWAIECKAVLLTPNSQQLEMYGGLPNKWYGSDHYIMDNNSESDESICMWDRPITLSNQRTIIIREDWAGETGLGGSLYNGGILLSKFLDSTYFSSGYFRDKFVAEIGAGCGLVGMTAIVLGAERVLLTDIGEDLLQHMQTNLETNLNTTEIQRITVRELDWIDVMRRKAVVFSPHLEVPQTQYGLILAAECVYEPKVVVPFLVTLYYLANPNSDIFVTGLLGISAQLAFFAAVPFFFILQDVHEAVSLGLIQAETPADRRIYKLTKRILGDNVDMDEIFKEAQSASNLAILENHS